MGRLVLLRLSLASLACLASLPPPARGAVFFREQFLDGANWQQRWVLSQHESNYGKFRLTAGNFYGDREADKGLQTTENSKFYAISSRFKPFSNKGRPLVIQYTVKHEQKIDCGGGYVKIFPYNLDQMNMSGESLYYVMFGPDICGSDTKKVHVILNYKDTLYPIKKQIRCKVDGFTHLYTLVLRPDHTYKVKIDNEMAASGILEDDWDFLPPRKINDPAVKKPENWDYEAETDDLEDTKPEDWDVSEFIVDNSARKPKDWDAVSQGDWQPPLLKNPLYRGEWRPRKIPNPKYKGIWPHPQMVNPAYVPDPSISTYDNVSVLGLELWQVRSGTVFDNFLITDDEGYAQEFGDETWGETKGPEQNMNMQQIEEEKRRERRRAQAEEQEEAERRKERKRKEAAAAPRKDKSEALVAQKEEL